MKWKKVALRLTAASALAAMGCLSANTAQAGYFEDKFNDLQQSLKNAINDAESGVKAEKYGTAADDFDHAENYSRQLRIYALSKYLPPPQPGFVPQNLEASQAVSDESLGAYTPGELSPNSVRQDYIKGDVRVEIIITADAPNAVLETANEIDAPAGQPGYGQGEPVTINGYAALVQSNPYPGYGGKNDNVADNVLVSVPFGGSYMVIGIGPKKETVAHLAAVDFNGLAIAQ